MRPKLLLHAGTHKTGTTSIQKYLASNQSWYTSRGIFYPVAYEGLARSETSHHAFVHGLTGVDAEAERASLAFAANLAVQAQTVAARSVIISAEPIYRHIDGLDQFSDLAVADYWSRREKYLSRLASTLEDFDIRVVLVLRRQDQFAESLHLSLCERGAGLASFDDFLTSIKPLTAYRRQIDLFTRIFGEVTVLSYHRLACSGDLVSAFMEALGLPVCKAEEPIWVRRTPDPRVIDWMDDMIRRGHKRGALRPFVASHFALTALEDSKTSLWESTERRDQFMAELSNDNAQLEREYPAQSGVPFFAADALLPRGDRALNDIVRMRLEQAYGQWLTHLGRNSPAVDPGRNPS